MQTRNQKKEIFWQYKNKSQHLLMRIQSTTNAVCLELLCFIVIKSFESDNDTNMSRSTL